jgi:ribosomal protein L37AE/L43A
MMSAESRSLGKALLLGILAFALSSMPSFAGSILKASCPCGFHSGNIYAGGGMGNFQTVCNAPAYCPACKALRVVNYLDAACTCAECGGKVVFYNDLSLQEKPPAAQGGLKKTIFSWNTDKKGVFVLPDTHYLCPACGKLTLTFEHIGLWD